MNRNVVLSADQIRQGIEACFCHAQKLKGAALSMLDRGEVGLALVVASVRVEELGKVKLLREMHSAGDGFELWKRFWKRFTHHDEKWLAMFEQTFVNIGTTYEESLEVIDPSSRRALEEVAEDFASGALLKNLGLYVDYDEEARSFVEPSARRENIRSLAVSTIQMGDRFEESLRQT